jgi:hypothetical protein
MRLPLLRFGLFSGMAFLAACAGDPATDGDGDPALASAAARWEALAGFEAWAQPTGWEGVKASCDGTHGPLVQSWANEAAMAALAAGEGPMADGAALIKAAYEADGTTLRGYALMEKAEGSAPDHGDWFWAMYDAGGVPTRAGVVSGCYGCHAGAAVDYARSSDGPGADSLDACGDAG